MSRSNPTGRGDAYISSSLLLSLPSLVAGCMMTLGEVMLDVWVMFWYGIVECLMKRWRYGVGIQISSPSDDFWAGQSTLCGLNGGIL